VRKMIAMCGLICNDCFAYIAKLENNDGMREKAVELWSTDEDRLKPSEIDCDGCLAGKALYKFCLVCDVRKCGLERSFKNCANCDRFPCEKLENLWRGFRTVSREVAKANLERIRSG